MKRKRGRPALDVDDTRRSVHVNVRLPAKTYDVAFAQAKHARVSVPELLRRAFRKVTPHE
jgi:hypothetical protein